MHSKRYITFHKKTELLSSFFLCVFIPGFVKHGGTYPILQNQALFFTTIISSISIVAGYAIWKRISLHATSLINVAWSFGVSFALSCLFILSTRTPYSGYVLFSSIILSLLWFTFTALLTRKYTSVTYGVLKAQDVEGLPIKKGLHYRVVGPDESLEGVEGIIVDTRFEFDGEEHEQLSHLFLKGLPIYDRLSFLEKTNYKLYSINSFVTNVFTKKIYQKIKSIFDYALVLLSSPISFPVFVVIFLCLWLTNGKPVIFKQQRVGRHGKEFTLYKFRTMNNSVKASNLTDYHTLKDDGRITKLGNYLRKSRLDEIPQLFNVLKGDMSLIGPRPEVKALSDQYLEKFPYYKYRFSIKPGISGWAQVIQGHVTGINSTKDKLMYDLYYIKNLSVWIDLLIIRKTITTIIKQRGAK